MLKGSARNSAGRQRLVIRAPLQDVALFAPTIGPPTACLCSFAGYVATYRNTKMCLKTSRLGFGAHFSFDKARFPVVIFLC
jgi:hypothetical protein